MIQWFPGQGPGFMGKAVFTEPSRICHGANSHLLSQLLLKLPTQWKATSEASQTRPLLDYEIKHNNLNQRNGNSFRLISYVIVQRSVLFLVGVIFLPQREIAVY